MLGFHPLGQGRHAQTVGQGDDGGDDDSIIGVRFQFIDEGAVNLDLVDREALEATQRRLARAEIIDGNTRRRTFGMKSGSSPRRISVARYQFCSNARCFTAA